MQANEPAPLLSICIPTYNRANFIGDTLSSIITQLTPDCEIVISDNASTDETADVIRGHAKACAQLRYYRQPSNVGSDRNYDFAVRKARGKYCWLMSDDDEFKLGAIGLVIEALREEFSLILVSYERRDITMKRLVLDNAANVRSSREYHPDELEKLLEDAGDVIYYGGSLVIKREIWMSRDRERYFGSLWIHIGVPFQERLPGRSYLIAEPLITYRDGNAKSYASEFMEVCTTRLASVVSTLAISDVAKRRICNVDRPWRTSWNLLLYRAAGCYALAEYRRLVRPRTNSVMSLVVAAGIAMIPGVLANCYCVLWESLRRARTSEMILVWLRGSPFYIGNLLTKDG